VSGFVRKGPVTIRIGDGPLLTDVVRSAGFDIRPDDTFDVSWQSAARDLGAEYGRTMTMAWRLTKRDARRIRRLLGRVRGRRGGPWKAAHARQYPRGRRK
jgi:hypothetical protein